MAFRWLRSAAPLVFGVGLAVTPSTAGTPLADIGGEYAGTLKSKNQVIDLQNEESGTDTSAIGLSIGQEGFSTSGTLMVFEDEGDFPFFVDGSAGNGKFHLRADDGEGGHLFLVGTMKGSPGKRVLKAKGAYLAPSHYSDVKVVLKEGPSGIE